MNGNATYPLARQGVFRTIQGEGAMLGVPMVFIRLAGCSVGCPLCDTDYAVHRRVPVDGLIAEVQAASQVGDWVWITGGDPADHNITPLVRGLREVGRFVAVATSGIKELPQRWEDGGPDWYSVSPHDPSKWVMHYGSELKLVPGLNGFSLKDFEPALVKPMNFGHRYVQPCDGKPETVAECVAWVNDRRGWKMTAQAHKQWRLA